MKRENLRAITMYVSQEDYELLQYEAKSHGCSVSHFCREVIRKYSPVELSFKRQAGAPTGNVNASQKKYYLRKAVIPSDEIQQRANKPQDE